MWPNRKVIGGTYAPIGAGGPTPPFDLGPDIPTSIRMSVPPEANQDYLSVEAPGVNSIQYQIEVFDEDATILVWAACIATGDDGAPYQEAIIGSTFGELITLRQQNRLHISSWKFSGLAIGEHSLQLINSGLNGVLAAVSTVEMVPAVDMANIFEVGNSRTNVLRLQSVGATGTQQFLSLATTNLYATPTATQVTTPIELFRELWVVLGESQLSQVWVTESGWSAGGGTYNHSGAKSNVTTTYAEPGGLGFSFQVSAEAGTTFGFDLVLSDGRVETFNYAGPFNGLLMDCGRAKSGDPVSYTQARFWATGTVSFTSPTLMKDPQKVGLALWSRDSPNVADPAILLEWERTSDACISNVVLGVS